ncbi:MAG: response regulator [Fibrobacter sp.]|nr:response regulator [Fibrobacter sp.]
MSKRIHFNIFPLLLQICAVLLLIFYIVSRWLQIDFLPVLAATCITFFIIFPVLLLLVNSPLKMIRKALDSGNLSQIKELATTSTGFGQLASLTLKFFQQREELIEEVSERKKAEIALRESEERYRSLVETSPDAIMLSDLNGNILIKNLRASKLFGESLDSQSGNICIFDLTPTEGRPHLESIFKEIKQKERIKAVECLMKKKDGKIFPAEISFSLVNASNDNGGAVISIVRNITERKKSELEKSKLEDQFRAIYKMEAVGQLASGIAHDFNNIMGAISGYADIIRHRYGEDPKLDKYAQMILSATTRASDLTGKLLTFARKSKLQMTAFDIHDVLNDVYGLLEYTIDKKFEVNCELNAADPVIIGDSTQFQSAIMNLALNSRDAMPDGGELVLRTENVTLDKDFSKSRAYIVAPGYYIAVSVKDTGTGMDKQVLSHIFEPFYTTKDVGKGTGLGLASVYGTLKSHNGYIDVESEPGKGTTFTLYFPVNRKTMCSDSEAPKACVHGKGHILVVDDEIFLLDAVQEMLTWLGYDVSVCTNGKDAVEFVKRDPSNVDLVILDMMMPNMNGRECFRQLKEIKNSIRALIATGCKMDDELQQVLKEGAIRIIQKPFVSAQLAEAVQDALSG